MSRRLAELLAAANLAKLQDDQAAREGAASAANTGQWINALQSLVPAATGALDKYQGSVAKDADTAAAQEIANHAADVGDNVDTPTTIASGAVAGNDKLAPKKPTGILDSLGALLGNRESAAAAAKAKATAGITGEVMANREKQRLIEKAKDDEAAKVARDEQARMDAAQAAADTREFQASENEANRQNARDIATGHDAAKPKKAPADPSVKEAKAETAALQRKKLELEIAALEKQSASGKPMNAADLERLTSARESLHNLADLKDIAGSQTTQGAFSAAQRAIPSWASALKSDERIRFEQHDARVKRTIAKAMEQGAITGGEQEMYNKMLADSSNSHSAYMQSLADIEKDLTQKQAAYEANLRNSGFNVPPDITRRDSGPPAASDPFADTRAQ